MEVDLGGRFGGFDVGKVDKVGIEQVKSIQFASLETRFVAFTVDFIELLLFAPY